MTNRFAVQLIWEQISFLLGVLGNTFVLHSSIRKNAIKMDNISVWIIRNLSTVDLLACFMVLLPIMINHYEDDKRWIFGKSFCFAFAAYQYTFACANTFLINVLSLNKLLRCVYPLRNLSPSRKQRVSISISMLAFSVVQAVSICSGYLSGFTSATYEYSTSLCKARIYNTIMTKIHDAITYIFITIVPCVTLVILNISLITFAILKSHRSVKIGNIVIVVTVTACFLVSFLPIIAALVFGDWEPFAWSFSLLSLWTNPVIYLLVNKQLRTYTCQLLRLNMKRSTVKENVTLTTMNNDNISPEV